MLINLQDVRIDNYKYIRIKLGIETAAVYLNATESI